MNYLLIVLLWTAYCVLHSFLISTGLTAFLMRLLKSYFAFYRFFYVVISLILLVPLLRFTARFESPVIMTYGAPLSIARHALILGSLLIFFRAFFFDYDSLSFFGIRQMLTFGKPLKTAAPLELKRKGLLGMVRHPMYLALILYLWCHTFRMVDLVINTLLTLYVFIGTRLEERKLVLEFGEAYIQYQKEVPMLIPLAKRSHARTSPA
jgi:protein-S-isoprenylcysteine O-methyltransferase Ste14